MPEDAIIVEDAEGRVTVGEARDIARYSDAARIAIGVMWIVGGLAGATVCLVVPIVHLISTWALPLIGILMGLRAFKRRVVMYQIAAPCPSCKATIESNGGSIDDLSWQRCSKCDATLRIRPRGDAAQLPPSSQ